MSLENKYEGADILEALKVAKNYNGYITSDIISSIGLENEFLDFGAGIGTFADLLRSKGARVSCYEPADELSGILRSKNFRTFSSMDELKKNPFQSIYSLNVLEHVENDVLLLQDLFHYLPSGARFYLYVPAMPCLFSDLDKKVGHFRRYKMKELRDKIETAGFKVKKVSYVDSVGALVTLVFKLLNREAGDINERTIKIYDQLFFPVSLMLDKLVSSFFGKNLRVVFHKP